MFAIGIFLEHSVEGPQINAFQYVHKGQMSKDTACITYFLEQRLLLALPKLRQVIVTANIIYIEKDDLP
ncbi:hypothetical protein [Lysinibacillus sp. 3P01SB]|uniref:hypothetical protein n=1 Tax=Lysinibacillus sp. 3P01SB TaxID=3132284 RepID=UPI0039A5C06E